METATRIREARHEAALSVRLSRAPDDVIAAQRLRHLCFIESAGLPPRAQGLDRDGFDDACLHLLVEDRAGHLLGCCRILPLASGAALADSYAALHYDLAPLAPHAAPMAEIGRFCLHPDAPAADGLRLAWAAITRLVDARGIAMLFGCASFPGADPARHLPALAQLARHHLGPEGQRPARDLREAVFPYAAALAGAVASPAGLPPLLRSYLGLGGWVGDHAVIDHDLDTLHVFTALPVASVPAARAQRLRDLAHQVNVGV
ncbi:MAG: GNAT family N-acetyltransferase [Rubellimicrobium sp.]|nr:GNAT family N-acetyltransferase [Rubellimicrobium sp.]